MDSSKACFKFLADFVSIDLRSSLRLAAFLRTAWASSEELAEPEVLSTSTGDGGCRVASLLVIVTFLAELDFGCFGSAADTGSRLPALVGSIV